MTDLPMPHAALSVKGASVQIWLAAFAGTGVCEEIILLHRLFIFI